jgi:hypothetical protein
MDGNGWVYLPTKSHDYTGHGRGPSTRRWGAISLFAALLAAAIAGGVVTVLHNNSSNSTGSTQAQTAANGKVRTAAQSSSSPGAGAAPPACTIVMAEQVNPPGSQAAYTLTSAAHSLPYSVEVSGTTGSASVSTHTTNAQGSSTGTVTVPNLDVVNRFTVAVTFTSVSGSVSCSTYFYTEGN